MIITITLLINITLSSVVVHGETTEETSNFTNLIVFARFAGEDEFVNTEYKGKMVREIIDNSYNTATYSVGDYYRNMSFGKLRMNTVYLYDKCGAIQLQHTRGYYAVKDDYNNEGYASGNSKEKQKRMNDLIEDWSSAINKAIGDGNRITNYDGSKVYDFNELDKNGDGKIDSITVIYRNTTDNYSVSPSDPLWNYKFDTNKVIVPLEGGRQLESNNYVQVTNNYGTLYQADDAKPIISLKTPIHEMGHIFRLKDLYCNDSRYTPVYFMSAMSNAISPIPQQI